MASLNKPQFSLEGKVALVTGAGRGIGLAIAEAFAGAGCAVAVQDIELTVAEKSVARLRDAGAKAVALGGDVTEHAFAEHAVRQTVDTLGGVHVLVNNAAIQSYQPWEQLAPEVMERQYRANIVTPLLLCQQVVPIFRQQRWGRIINIGSIQQLHGTPGMLAYSMSKAALWNMTTGLAHALGRDGITVNVIAPGYFDTYRNREQFKTDADRERAGKHMPLGRIGNPEDCAGAALLLASDAGAYITGQSLHVDGGMSIK